MKKTLVTSALALVVASSAALADGPICEREITLYRDGQLVDTTQLTFYPHGCDRFQYSDLDPVQANALIASQNCSVESSSSGGGCGEGEEMNDEGQCVRVVEVEREVTDQVPTEVVEEVPVPRGEFDGTEREFRVTSMDGTNTVRVRRSDGRAVDLRIGGNTVLSIPAGAPGEAYFDLPEGQSFGGLKIHDAGTGQALRNGTASTNGNIWNGTTTVTTTVLSPVTRTVTETRTLTRDAVNESGWNDGMRNRQPGPRTERCGFPGEAIPPLQ